MAKNINIETIRLKLEDFGKLKSVGSAFNKLNKSLAFTPKQINETIKSITKFDQRNKGANNTAVRSVATYNKQISALRELQNNVAIGGKAYRAFGAEADKLRAQLEALTKTQQKQKGLFGKIGVGGRAALGAAAGSVTAGLGSTAQLALTGGVVGGGVGAAVGAGLGAAIDTTKFAAESATYAASIQKLRIALAGVTDTQEDFQYGLNVVARVSKELNVPIAASTRQFTTLAASVLGAGGTIEDAELVFEGVSSAIKATGGNAEDVQSAIRAMSQIFGKGKVSAEELQGQLGERLAGAVVKFAEANGSSLQKLQKDLRDGTVGLDQVIKFAQKLNVDFGETAKQVANSSADAGARLKVQMDELKLAVGEAVLPIGAAFQETFADIGKGILENEELMLGIANTFKIIGAAAFTTFAAIKFLIRALVDLFQIQQAILRLDFKEIGRIMSKGFEDTAQNAKEDFERIGKIFQGIEAPKVDSKKRGTGFNKNKGLPKLSGDLDGKEAEKLAKKNLDLRRGIVLKQTEDETDRKILERKYEFIDAVKEAKLIQDETQQNERIALLTKDFIIDKQNIINEGLEKGKEKAFDFAEEFRKISEKATDLKSRVGELALDVTNKLGDAFADFFVEGKRGFRELAVSAIKELNKIIIKAAFMKFIANPITKALGLADGGVVDGGEIVPSAKGNVFAKNKIVPYAYGGIIDRPTLMPLANGAALAGEAGAEAIMPLKRGRDGKLGVAAQGGGIGNIVVNVDASGSSVEGNTQQSSELGKMLGSVIQAELIKQKRPGGLLS